MYAGVVMRLVLCVQRAAGDRAGDARRRRAAASAAHRDAIRMAGLSRRTRS